MDVCRSFENSIYIAQKAVLPLMICFVILLNYDVAQAGCPNDLKKINEPFACPSYRWDKGPQEWYILTAWKRYLENNRDQNIFNQGVEKFVEHIQNATQNYLKIHICTLDQLEYTLGKKVKPTDILRYLNSSHTFQMVHLSPSYWGDVIPGAKLMNTIPFGMTPNGVEAWLKADGLKIWRQIYEEKKLYTTPMGNTGIQMGGWYREEINKLQDLSNKKMRISGLGEKVLLRLNRMHGLSIPTPVHWFENELYQKINHEFNNANIDIDAIEWVGPYADIQLNIHTLIENEQPVFKYYYFPGWHSPGNLEELVMSLDEWNCIPKHLQTIIKGAAAIAHHFISTTFEVANVNVLDENPELKSRLRPIPVRILYALWEASEEVLREESENDVTGAFKLIYDSYKAFRAKYNAWEIIANDAYTSSLHHSGDIAPYYKLMLEAILGGKLTADFGSDIYRAVIGDSLIQFPVNQANFSNARTPLQQKNQQIAENILERISLVLLMNPPKKIIVYGHTDASGSAASNLELSKNRANFVKKHFTDAGLNGDKIDAQGCGEEYRISQDPAENRRVSLELRYGTDGGLVDCAAK